LAREIQQRKNDAADDTRIARDVAGLELSRLKTSQQTAGIGEEEVKIGDQIALRSYDAESQYRQAGPPKTAQDVKKVRPRPRARDGRSASR